MPLTEYRQDIGSSIEAKLDDNGYLRITGIAAKTGVLTYLLPDGSMRRELVPAETLLNNDSIETLIGAPVTIEHPMTIERPALLDSSNASTYSQGSVPKVTGMGDRLSVSIVVTSGDAIAKIQSGKCQLSPGYRAELKMISGVHNGQHYDAIQTKRVYNHLAIVDRARGGEECKLNLDGFNCAIEVNQTKEVTKMATVKLTTGATVEVADASTATALQNEINALGVRADSVNGMVEREKFDELQGKYDAMASELEKLKGESSAKMDSAEISEFITILEQAKKLNPEIKVDADGVYLSKVELMASAIKVDSKDKSAEYIKGRFDSAVELSAAEHVRKQREIKTDSAPALSAVDQHKQNFYKGKA